MLGTLPELPHRRLHLLSPHELPPTPVPNPWLRAAGCEGISEGSAAPGWARLGLPASDCPLPLLVPKTHEWGERPKTTR